MAHNRCIASRMTAGKAPIKRLTDALNRNPIVRRAKNWRNELLDRHFRARGHAQANELVDALRVRDTNGLCFTIAFNAPWVIEILVAAWARYPTGLTLVVADNSSNHEKRAQIKLICQTHGIGYIALPKNLEWNPNRSHGIAINWVFYNLVKKMRPEIFGFIDHDCFPYKPFDIAKRIDRMSIYGLKHMSSTLPGIWNIWAGFCFFRFSDVENRALDFKHRVELGLDTGGGNWLALYREIDSNRFIAAKPGSSGEFLPDFAGLHCVIDDAFIHVGDASCQQLFDKAAQRRDISDRIWKTCLGGIAKRALNEF